MLHAVKLLEMVRDEPFPVTPTLRHADPVPGISATTVVTLQQEHLLQHQQLHPLKQQWEQQQQPPPQQQQPYAPSQQHQPSYPKQSRLEEQASLTEELALVRETKVICPLDLLLELFKTCHHSGCGQPLMPKHHLIGLTVIIKENFPHLKISMRCTPIIFKLLLR